MCLILVAWQVHADFPLVVAANRDEFHARPASSAAFWPDSPAILAGRDLQIDLARTREPRMLAPEPPGEDGGKQDQENAHRAAHRPHQKP